eukprot:2149347-Pyramimonas_sp.AAC.1
MLLGLPFEARRRCVLHTVAPPTRASGQARNEAQYLPRKSVASAARTAQGERWAGVVGALSQNG